MHGHIPEIRVKAGRMERIVAPAAKTGSERAIHVDLQARKEELAWACRIMHMAGQTDMTLGHISSREAGQDTFLMKPKGLGFDEVCPEDIITLDMNGQRVAGHRPVHFETPIHTEIFRARPDVGCVIHAHPRLGTPLAAAVDPLPAVSHDGVLFAEGLRVYTGSPELVIAVGHGQELVDALGDGHVLLLRNHGTIIAHKNICWAVITAIVLERAIEMYLNAKAIGPFHEITPDLAKQMYASKYNDKLIAEYWDYWVRRCIRGGGAQGMPEPRPVWNPGV